MAESRRTITGTTTTTRDRLSPRSKRLASRGQGFSTGDASAGFLSGVTASAWGGPSLALPRGVASLSSCGTSAMPHWTPSLPPGTSARPATAAGDVDRHLLWSSQLRTSDPLTSGDCNGRYADWHADARLISPMRAVRAPVRADQTRLNRAASRAHAVVTHQVTTRSSTT